VCAGWGARRIALPTYAFDRARYWPDAEGAAQGAVAPVTPVAPAPTVVASGGLRTVMQAIWSDVFGLESVGLRDNFFDLGGQSLQAIRVLNQLGRHLGREIPLALLVDAPTIDALAERLEADAPPARVSLVPLQAGGSRPPFFCVHPGGGTVLLFHALARRLGPDQPFYGLQAAGLDGRTAPHRTIEAMAAGYLAEVRAVRPHGPYQLGGMCWGSNVAFEMACRLRAQGEQVALLAVIDGRQPPWPADGVAGIKGDAPRDEGMPGVVLGAWAFAANRVRALRAFSRYVWSAQGRRVIHMEHLHKLARRAYRAQRLFDGDITLFRVGSAVRAPAYEAGWARLTTGRLVVHPVEGEHHTVHREPHVRSLAEKLGAALR
jgi:thioesterase domain-containing protein/aryl carrier-like protein